MLLKTCFLLVAALAISLSSGEKARFDKFRVYRVFPTNHEQTSALNALESSRLGYDFWTPIRLEGPGVDILVPPNKFPQFHEFLGEHKLEHTVFIDDVQRLVEEEGRSQLTKPKAFGWTAYYPLEDIYSWLASLEQRYPTIVKQVVGGESYEGREIRGIEINFNSNNPGVYLESGIHAREWIGPAASSWIVNEILESSSNSLWRRFNYLYFPSVNPDGYAYTFTRDRLWRKTRKPYRTSLGTCYGADPNRNWDNHWLVAGSSSFACDETYGGSEPFSEPETKSLSNYLLRVGSRYDIFVAFHSYSQLLMFPWGWTSTHAPHHNLWQRIGELAAEDIRSVHGLRFQVGNIHDAIYPASGSSLEWFYGVFNNTLTYTFETRDTGRYGFVLPPEQIIPGGEELQAGIARFLTEYEKLKRN